MNRNSKLLNPKFQTQWNLGFVFCLFVWDLLPVIFIFATPLKREPDGEVDEWLKSVVC